MRFTLTLVSKRDGHKKTVDVTARNAEGAIHKAEELGQGNWLFKDGTLKLKSVA